MSQSGIETGSEQAGEAARLYRRTYLAERRLVPGADALLRVLRRSVRLGIVSNNILAEQEDKLAYFNLRSVFDVLVVSAEEGVSKPEPGIFRVALARLGCPAEDAVMVGDTWAADILGAASVGMRAVWFNQRGEPVPDPSLAVEIRSLEPTEAVSRTILDGHSRL